MQFCQLTCGSKFREQSACLDLNLLALLVCSLKHLLLKGLVVSVLFPDCCLDKRNNDTTNCDHGQDHLDLHSVFVGMKTVAYVCEIIILLHVSTLTTRKTNSHTYSHSDLSPVYLVFIFKGYSTSENPHRHASYSTGRRAMDTLVISQRAFLL